jgi:hypothetical protein
MNEVGRLQGEPIVISAIDLRNVNGRLKSEPLWGKMKRKRRECGEGFYKAYWTG